MTKVRCSWTHPCLVIKPLVIAVENAQDLIRTIEPPIAGARRGEIVRSGTKFKLSIFGPPDAGKSS